MEKDFDLWSLEKKQIDQKEVNRDLFFDVREIWWCSAGLNIGIESNGKNENFERPMLIIKKFNGHMAWALPLTTKEKQGRYYYELVQQGKTSWVMLSQIKTISTKRLLRKIGTIPTSSFLEIIQRVTNMMKIESPLAGAISDAEATNICIVD